MGQLNNICLKFFVVFFYGNAVMSSIHNNDITEFALIMETY